MTIDPTHDHPVIEIDALGKPCPMPLLMLKRAIKSSLDSHFFLLKSSDPNSEIDILRYCQMNNLKCDMKKVSASEFLYSIEI